MTFTPFSPSSQLGRLLKLLADSFRPFLLTHSVARDFGAPSDGRNCSLKECLVKLSLKNEEPILPTCSSVQTLPHFPSPRRRIEDQSLGPPMWTCILLDKGNYFPGTYAVCFTKDASHSNSYFSLLRLLSLK
jgi:hypothetical protein